MYMDLDNNAHNLIAKQEQVLQTVSAELLF